MFFVFEGLDGVGKTTLLNSLEKKGFRIYHSPVAPYDKIRKSIHNKGDISSFFFYLSANSYIIENNENKIFLLDRYIVSSLIAYLFTKNKYLYKDFLTLYKKFEVFFKLPTLTFFLKLDENTRLSRLKERENNEFDEIDINYTKLWNEVINHYDLSKKILIDANCSEQTLVEEVLFHLNKYIKGGI